MKSIFVLLILFTGTGIFGQDLSKEMSANNIYILLGFMR
jgi:hypothetical protein